MILYDGLRALYRFFYRVTPCKNKLVHFIRSLGIRGGVIASHIPLGNHLGSNTILRIHVADTRVRIRSHDLPLENRVFWEGLGQDWEKVSLGLWMRLCKISRVVFDVGANIGLYSLAAKVANPQVEVYAFEPLSANYKILTENCTLNHFDVRCQQVALSSIDGEGYMRYSSFDAADRAHLSCNTTASVSEISEKTRMSRLDSFIAEHGIGNIDAIKIDVERHEKEVLDGLGKCLKTMRPSIIIEILNDDIGSHVEKIVKDCGYLFFNIDEKGQVTKDSSITKSDYFNYLLCGQQQAQQLGLLS